MLENNSPMIQLDITCTSRIICINTIDACGNHLLLNLQDRLRRRRPPLLDSGTEATAPRVRQNKKRVASVACSRCFNTSAAIITLASTGIDNRTSTTHRDTLRSNTSFSSMRGRSGLKRILSSRLSLIIRFKPDCFNQVSARSDMYTPPASAR